MTTSELMAISPLIVLASTTVAMVLVLAFLRSHRVTLAMALSGLALAVLLLPKVHSPVPRAVGTLFLIDGFSVFYLGLIAGAAMIVALLSFGYLERQEGRKEEFHVLLVSATLGAGAVVCSCHFASFFLGLEVLSVSLYALIAYRRTDLAGIEAGVKYLVLAGASAAILLFGMALVYAELGTMSFSRLVLLATDAGGRHSPMLLVGMAMMMVGFGFKLALVPFHLWTPDVYQGAPAPVTAFVAGVSKGAMFALLLRYLTRMGVHSQTPLLWAFAMIAVASMIAGNVLALMQKNVKRLLAYSSIAHLGYLMVAFLAGGALAGAAVAFYLAAYVVTTLGAFGVVGMLSGPRRDAEEMEDYQGLAWRRPVVAGVFTAMLLSLAGIPLTAGFVGKFHVAAAGVESHLWALVVCLAVNSAIGLYYYLRLVLVMYGAPGESSEARREAGAAAALPITEGVALVALTGLLIFLGVYPAPLVQMIRALLP